MAALWPEAANAAGAYSPRQYHDFVYCTQRNLSHEHTREQL